DCPADWRPRIFLAFFRRPSLALRRLLPAIPNMGWTGQCGKTISETVFQPLHVFVMTRHLITSALPYINGIKHLGNLIGSMLPADVHARFRRQAGDNVLFICGTDEHGTPAELGAHAAGQDVRSYCDEQHALQADVYRRVGL